MYGRTYADGEAALEALLRQVDAEVAGALGGGASQEAVPEALAFALDGEAMDPADLLTMSASIPLNLKQELFQRALQLWKVRDAIADKIAEGAKRLIMGGKAASNDAALTQAAKQLGVESQPGQPAQKGADAPKAKGAGQPRQRNRPARKKQREFEAEAEAVARLLEPWPEYLRDDDEGFPDEADYMSRQRGQGNILTRCQEILTPEQYNHLNNLAVQKANKTGHRGGGRRTRDKHQGGATSNKERMLRAACRLAVQSGYQAAVNYLMK